MPDWRSAAKARAAQAAPITVVILIGVTIALGLMLYALTQGQLLRAQEERNLENVRFYASLSLFPSLLRSDVASDGASTAYCYTASVLNQGVNPLRFYVTVMPGVLRESFIEVSGDIARVPMDYGGGDFNGRINVKVFLVRDVDGDGLATIVDPSSGGETGVPITSCSRLKSLLNDPSLSVAGLPAELAHPSNVDLGGISLSSLLERHGLNPDQYRVPLWSFYLNPGDSTIIYVYVEPVDRESGTAEPILDGSLILSFHVYYGDSYVLVDAMVMPVR